MSLYRPLRFLAAGTLNQEGKAPTELPDKSLESLDLDRIRFEMACTHGASLKIFGICGIPTSRKAHVISPAVNSPAYAIQVSGRLQCICAGVLTGAKVYVRSSGAITSLIEYTRRATAHTHPLEICSELANLCLWE